MSATLRETAAECLIGDYVLENPTDQTKYDIVQFWPERPVVPVERFVQLRVFPAYNAWIFIKTPFDFPDGSRGRVWVRKE